VRIFLDTNVLVSAFASRGLSADLLELVLIEHDLVMGRATLRELERVLRSKIRLPPSRCAEVLGFLASEALPVVEQAKPAECDADDDDRRILGEALAGNADIFVTGDAALVKLGRAGATGILTPRQLWERLRGR
jgi:putative PIN family toxin of toxin-antitoxin system